MHVAVIGCLHGNLDAVYKSIPPWTDVVLVCGDFQAVRDGQDLRSMAVPPKYRQMGDFAPYYYQQKVAPVLTVVIGGNHEASRFMSKLSVGGWLAPRIYYLGNANVIQIGGYRIGGISGIYFEEDYYKPHFENVHADHLNGPMIRSIYHTREEDVMRLIQLSGESIDIFLSHDWPQDIAFFGNVRSLIEQKPWLADDIHAHTLGSPPLRHIMDAIKPRYWFSAHLHCRFEAQYKSRTHFVALDKVLPRRKFIYMLDLPGDPENIEVALDPRWLALIKNPQAPPGSLIEPFKVPDFESPEKQTQKFLQLLSEAKTLKPSDTYRV